VLQNEKPGDLSDHPGFGGYQRLVSLESLLRPGGARARLA
jgi:hypothetical protein